MNNKHNDTWGIFVFFCGTLVGWSVGWSFAYHVPVVLQRKEDESFV